MFKVAPPPQVEIWDKQRLVDEGPSGGEYGVHSQKAPQDSQVHQNTSAGFTGTFWSQRIF